jgi:LemA protein
MKNQSRPATTSSRHFFLRHASASTSKFFPKKKQFSRHSTRESESNQQLVRQPTFFKWKRLTGWRTSSIKFYCISLFLLSVVGTGCGYNRFQSLDEDVKSKWADVLNQYQRRADLIPNVVNTVKGYASHEKDVLERVTLARARATQTIAPQGEGLNNPQAIAQFESAQREVSGALSRLLVVAENYPQLKADKSFEELQVQLEGTENRITIARGNFITSVKEFNTLARSFPSNITAKIFGYAVKESFTVEDEKAVASPPKVEFNN